MSMYRTKGDMIKELKEAGIRTTPEGVKLKKAKGYQIINLYTDKIKNKEGD